MEKSCMNALRQLIFFKSCLSSVLKPEIAWWIVGKIRSKKASIFNMTTILIKFVFAFVPRLQKLPDKLRYFESLDH